MTAVKSCCLLFSWPIKLRLGRKMDNLYARFDWNLLKTTHEMHHGYWYPCIHKYCRFTSDLRQIFQLNQWFLTNVYQEPPSCFSGYGDHIYDEPIRGKYSAKSRFMRGHDPQNKLVKTFHFKSKIGFKVLGNNYLVDCYYKTIRRPHIFDLKQ